MSGGTIVFVGLARDVAAYLPGVTKNIENFAKGFDSWAVLVAENDSADATRAGLHAWMAEAAAKGAVRADVIALDGLEARFPERTDRIAAARNHILKEIEADETLRRFDYLAVLDMDFPNSISLRADNFHAAITFLREHDDVAGVFPNALPYYYDIWALREENWCPRDCWEEARQAAPQMGEQAAVVKYVYSRQIAIDPARPPIAVDSAFGGMGLYRLAGVLGHVYTGHTEAGLPICEHVPFHESIRAAKKKFFILPDFLNLSAFEHTALSSSHAMIMAGENAAILAANPVANRHAQFPRVGEKFGALASLLDGQAILDLAPEGGLHLIRARLKGFRGPYVCVEGDETGFATLGTNLLLHGELCGDVSVLRGGRVEQPGLLHLGTGADAAWLMQNIAALPSVLWARIESAEEADDWGKTLSLLPYKHVTAFNAYGARVADGALAEQRQKLIAQFHRLLKNGGGVDLVFFADGATAAAFRAL